MQQANRLLFLATALLIATSTQAADPVVGKWFGTGGSPQDTTEFGFDIREEPDGKLIALAYQPVLNLFGEAVNITREGDEYKIPAFGAALRLSGDELAGTFTRLAFPMKLRRTTTLPEQKPVPALPKGPAPLWQTRLNGTIYAAVASRDGIAYVGTTGGVMNAVKTTDGSMAWTFSAGRPIHGEALVTAEEVYFTCDNGYLFKLNRADGKELWRYDLGDSRVDRVLPHPTVFEWDYASAKPVIAGDAVYVGSGDGSMHAVNASTGKQIWRFATKAKIRADALVVGDRVYFGSMDNGVYALNRNTGEQLWRQETRAPVTSSPVMINGNVVIGNRGAGLYALNPENGEVAWRALMWGSWVESTAGPAGDRFYIGTSDLRRTICYDSKDGRVIWRTDVYGWNWGRPLVTEKFVYVGAAAGKPYVIRHDASLVALDRATGKIAWRWPYPPNESHQWGFPAGPVLEGKVLVIAAIDGTIYGFPAQ